MNKEILYYNYIIFSDILHPLWSHLMPTTKIGYLQAISQVTDTGVLACNTLHHRLIRGLGVGQNVATFMLDFKDGRAILKTVESSGTRDLRGHSERRALAIAINEAIKNNLGLFSHQQPINNIFMPEPSEFERFKIALQALKSVQLYTERIPCNLVTAEIPGCQQFFSALLQNVPHMFYYSIEAGESNRVHRELTEEIQQVLQHDDILGIFQKTVTARPYKKYF